MENKILKVYCASGWFSESQESILTNIENYLRGKDNVKPYFPRHDGVKLEANQFHDPKLREKVFLDNLKNIDEADFVVANLDGREGYLDTGTCYEVGYAMARGIPVIGYQDDENGKLMDLIGSVSGGFVGVCTGIEELDAVVDTMTNVEIVKSYVYTKGTKVLYISPDNNEENVAKGVEVANVLIECYGKNFKWVDKLSSINLSNEMVDSIFKDVEYMVAVIDDRHPVVSWMMGQAFARHVPIVSYTNYDFGVNLMLICSIVSHVKGINNIKETIQIIKREGIESLGKFDNGDVKVF